MAIGGVGGTGGIPGPNPIFRSSTRNSAGLRSRSSRLTDLRSLLSSVSKLGQTIDGLMRSTRLRRVRLSEVELRLEKVSVGSGEPLSLNLDATATSLESTGEINSVPTSYSPREPDFPGSTVSPTVGGIYDGSNGDDTLTFQVTRGGIVGVSNLRIDVFDGGGNRLDVLIFGRNYEPGTERTLSNGLTFSLSAGRLKPEDLLQVDVSATVGSTVDPDNPFNGTGASDPNFDPGRSVTAGFFEINGAKIEIASADSLNDVIARINSSSAGVQALFDATSERIRFTQNSLGSQHDIVFGEDTSGFLTANKLKEARPTYGLNDERTTPLSQVAAFAGVRAGVLSINDNDVAFDPSTDSLNTILERISDARVGVTATFEQEKRGVVFTAKERGTSMTLKDRETGLLRALGIASGTYEATEEEEVVTTTVSKTIAAKRSFGRTLDDLVDVLDGLFQGDFKSATGSAEGIRTALKTAVAESFKGLDHADATTLKSKLGIAFDFNSEGSVLRLDDGALGKAMNDRAGELAAFLKGRKGSDRDGLLESLGKAVRQVEKDLQSQLAPGALSGVFFDSKA